MFYSASGNFTKKSIKEGFLDVFQGYVHKHDKTELNEIKSDINEIKDKADDLSKEVKSSKRNFYGLYSKVSDFDQKFDDLDEIQDEIDQKFSYLDEVQDEIDHKFNSLDEVQDVMEQQINEMNHFKETVGIGTPPQNDYKLDVNGDVRINGGVVGKGSLNDGVYFPLRHSDFKDHEQILIRNNGDIYMGSGKDREITFFNGNPSERKNEFMNMKNGNIGIGTSPNNNYKLDVNGGINLNLKNGTDQQKNSKAINVYKNFTGVANGNYVGNISGIDHNIGETGVRFLEKGGNDFRSNQTKVLNVLSNNDSKMVVTGSGNVGIGTNSPSALLEIKKPLTNSGSFPAGNLKFSTTNGANNWDLGEIEGYVAAGTGGSADSYPGGLAFKTKNIGAHDKSLTTKMVLDAKGNVGIGTTAPSSTLDVNGSFKAKNILHPIRNHNGNFSSYWHLGGRRIFHWIAAIKGSSSYENICNIEIDYLVNFGRSKGNGTHNRFCRSVGKLTVNWIDYGPTGGNENQYKRHIWYKKTEKKFSPMAYLEFYILRKHNYVYIGVAMNGQRSENMAYWGNYDVKVLGDSIQETKIFTRDDEFCLYSHNEDHLFSDWDNTSTRFNADAILDPKHLKPDSWRKDNGSYIDRDKVDFSNSWETTNGYTWDNDRSLWGMFTNQEKNHSHS